MKVNDLLLLSGNDIPFPEAKIVIHQPRIREIAFMGEDGFYGGCEFLKFSKDNLTEEDRINLERYSNFEVLMSIMKENNEIVNKHKIYVQMLFTLLFPQYKMVISDGAFELQLEDNKFFIDKNNFESFKEILDDMFCLKGDSSEEYKPIGEAAKKIAEKLKKRHQKLNQEKTESEKKISVLNRYVSILSVGENKDMNSLLDYTVYQLFDEFKRYQLKEGYDIYFQAKMAGAQDLKEPEDWMQDIHK